MTESDLQIAIADYLRLQYPDVIFHSDYGSGAKLTPIQARKQNRQNGGLRGWPDLFIAEQKYEEIEQWADVNGYEGTYKVSDRARVKRVDGKSEHLLGCHTNAKNGYVYVALSKNGKRKSVRLHRLVAEAFIPNPNKKPQVNHIDGNKANNVCSNLEWTTASENQLHRYNVLKKSGGGRPPVKVRCVETGEEYGTIAEVTRATGIGHIAAVLRGERNFAGGYRWQKL